MVCFVDPSMRNVQLLELIRCGEFVMLRGPRSSGKSTRVLEIHNQLKTEDLFVLVSRVYDLSKPLWKAWVNSSRPSALIDASEYNELDNRHCITENKWNYQLVLLIDEYRF
ncbi:16550_t:CDS:2 [Funneliformis caledonium]|uniref:16550_t:CDS:1 n=1 Tax=Funneliformis caledonium TaxID=1117310 RepID=A0A9N9GAN2_9GLOM|nr:16550_t:CDS:2 [Funneliformis caledonium]